MPTNTIDGVWIDDDKIEIFDPATGKELARWDNPSRETVDVALAIRAFYVEGREAFKRHNDEKRFTFHVVVGGHGQHFNADSAEEAAKLAAAWFYNKDGSHHVVVALTRIAYHAGNGSVFQVSVDGSMQAQRIKVRLDDSKEIR